jgi:two-component system nitrogen regulation response regulator GlnG
MTLAIRGEKSSRQTHRSVRGEALKQCAREELSFGPGQKTFTDIIDRFASVLIAEALNLTAGNRSQAAKMLGLSRPTLLAKIEKYGIKIETAAKSD